MEERLIFEVWKEIFRAPAEPIVYTFYAKLFGKPDEPVLKSRNLPGLVRAIQAVMKSRRANADIMPKHCGLRVDTLLPDFRTQVQVCQPENLNRGEEEELRVLFDRN